LLPLPESYPITFGVEKQGAELELCCSEKQLAEAPSALALACFALELK